MESLVTDHPPSPTDKGLELLVGGVGLSAPHLVLSAALNRQKQPWFGQKWPSTPHLPPEPRKAKWRSGWGLEKRGLGRPRGGLCWRPKVLQGAHSVCTSKGVLQKNRTGRKYRLGVGLEREREGDLKELAYKLMEVGKSEIFRVGGEAGDPGRTCYSSKTVWKQDSFLFGAPQSLS